MATGRNIPNNHYTALLQRDHVPCDFCDRTFKNRFRNIIHTASHIIIPLLKQNWHKCNLCLYYFPSQQDLDDHHKTKHSDIEKPPQNVNIYTPKIKLEDSDEINVRYLALENIKQESDDHSIDTHKHNSIEMNKNVAIKLEKLELDYDSGIIDDSEKRFKEVDPDNVESFKSRLRFEEDGLFDDDILNNLITGCKVKMFNEPINEIPKFKNLKTSIDSNGINSYKNSNGLNIRNMIKSNFANIHSVSDANYEINKTNNNIVTDEYEYDKFIRNPKEDRVNKVGSKNVQIIGTNALEVTEPEYKSIHYVDLIRPGIYSCKMCSKSFPNRLLLIQHEVKHIHIKKPRPLLCTYCDKYISGNYVTLRNHIAARHPGVSVEKKHMTHKCPRCSLKFRKYLTHVKNYHPYDCRGCGKEFEERTLNEMEIHAKICTTQSVLSKILNVCELCYSFLKVTKKLKYISLGTTAHELGVRYPCAVCGKKFFELMKIKRTLVGVNNHLKGNFYKNKKPLTNEERLKKFQHRLKRINLLNKFYFVVLFSFGCCPRF